MTRNDLGMRGALGLVLIAGFAMTVWGGGVASSPCTPEELHWKARDWHAYMCKGQQAVRDAYRKVEEIENEQREALRRKVSVVPWEKDRYGDPMYVRYGPRAYEGTPQYVGPRYVSSFHPRTPTYTFRTQPQVADPSVYVPSAPARSDVVLRPGAARSY